MGINLHAATGVISLHYCQWEILHTYLPPLHVPAMIDHRRRVRHGIRAKADTEPIRISKPIDQYFARERK